MALKKAVKKKKSLTPTEKMKEKLEATKKELQTRTCSVEKNVLTSTAPKKGTGIVSSDNVIKADK